MFAKENDTKTQTLAKNLSPISYNYNKMSYNSNIYFKFLENILVLMTLS